MTKKICAVICSFLLVSSALCGCTDTENTPDSSASAIISGADGPSIDETSDISYADDAAEVVLSHKAGFYSEGIELTLSCSIDGAKIYYTTDGSTPDETSTLYEAPIRLENRSSQPNILSAMTGTSAGGDYIPRKPVNKANIIRAAAYLPDGTVTPVSNAAYFIGIDRAAEYGDVPVISLMTDNKNLYNYETGIYILGQTYDNWLAEDENNRKLEAWQAEGNYSNRGREWERPVVCQYITSDGAVGFTQDMGIRIMGAASRNATQKSFRLTAREDYGKKAVEYELIPDNLRSDGSENVTKYKSFVLRNGGNDCDYAKIRDPYFQQLVEDRSFETQQYDPCVVYLNGEYWGMYTLVEDYNDNYIENNYGIDNKNAVIIKCGELEEGEENDIELFYELYDFVCSNDMSVDENYLKAAQMIDMQSFADYCAFNLYIFNEDSIFKNNNWRMWRVRTPDSSSPYADGKWRMMVYDTDYSAGIYGGGNNYSKDNITGVFNGSAPTVDKDGNPNRDMGNFFRALCANEDFIEMFLISMCDIRNINFENNSALNTMMELYEVYGGLVPDTFSRFGPDWIARQKTDRYYEGKINELANFVDGRYFSMPEIIKETFALNDPADFTLTVSGNGSVTINSSGKHITESLTGKYFTEYPITVNAHADSGTFKEWKFSGCELSDPTSPSTTVTFTGDFTIEAVFE